MALDTISGVMGHISSETTRIYLKVDLEALRSSPSRTAHVVRRCCNGPRLHDLRHTFAVHRLEDWYRQGADLGAKLPVLSA